MLTPIEFMQFRMIINLLPQKPKEYRVMIILRIPSVGPRYEMTEGIKHPKKLKSTMTAKESHQPSLKRSGPSAPVVGVTYCRFALHQMLKVPGRLKISFHQVLRPVLRNTGK